MVKVVRVHQLGPPEAMQIEDLEVGAPGEGEALVRVEAIGLNRSEALFREGKYIAPPKLPALIGYEASGVLLAISIVIGVPFFFVAPSIAGRLRHQGHLIAGLTLLTVAGWAGLGIAPESGAWVWAALLGAGGAVFPVVLLCFALRTATTADTAALSTMGQSVGYLIAAGGPFVVGMLHHTTGGWGLPCALLVVLGAVQVSAGYLAGRPVTIGR